MTDRVRTGAVPPPGPLRTCIGCRQRAVDHDLLRVVADSDSGSLRAVPDPRRRASGRGAWVHRDLACVDLAIRRRAFGRALRVAAPMDPGPVREHVAAQQDQHHQDDQHEPGKTPPAESRRR
ncbi:YlxR family protein [uncultured Jatrophihabitans sp.]|uniref:YlxR family protein n=1 Tax=uncultured Jatrophihabitans sp. TaxID=1610747 RepID=UPI0035CB1930